MSKTYDVLYLEALNKVILYHESSIVFEGTINDVPKCMQKLTEVYQADIKELTDDANEAMEILNNLDIKSITN